MEKELVERVKFFKKESSHHYCNYGMLLLGKNRKKLRQGVKPTEFFSILEGIIKHNVDGQGLKLQMERSGYLIFKDKGKKVVRQKLEHQKR